MTISNTDEVIDSREVIARIEEIESWLEDEPWQAEYEADELTALRALAHEVANCAGGWPEGATLISDSYFGEYAQQFAEDIGAISGDNIWPVNHIDWDAVVKDLQADYTRVDFDGADFWVRG